MRIHASLGRSGRDGSSQLASCGKPEPAHLTEATLRRQASDLNSVITSVRGYYATNIVGRVLASPGSTKVVHNYEDMPGAIPIPATLSLELGRVIGEQQRNISYRFVSDYPFKGRSPHVLDEFETNALKLLRENSDQKLVNVSATMFSDRVRFIAPIILGAACVSCHNSHPDSPKRDWKTGDVRGIQEITISQSRRQQYPSLSNICSPISSSWRRQARPLSASSSGRRRQSRA